MNRSSLGQRITRLLFLSVGIITFLILLINSSFKVVLWHGLVFSVTSLVCPLIAGLYLMSLSVCTFKEQRHVLNSSLVALYLFCIGVYILVNLPAAEYMNDNKIYQIIFDDIPKKFFAATSAFAISFYLPHLVFCRDSVVKALSPKQSVILALVGGSLFFCINFYCLFSGPHAHFLQRVFIDSFMITFLLLLVIGVAYLFFSLDKKQSQFNGLEYVKQKEQWPIFYYLVCFAVILMLACAACEYRIVRFGKDNLLTASCIFFPIVMIISTLISEHWGYQAHIKLIIALFAAQLIFDAFLLSVMTLPSPRFLNLNPFYNYILPRKVPATSASSFFVFVSNSLLLGFFQRGKWALPRPARIVIANLIAGSLLCFIDYRFLFWGVYPPEQVMNLVVHVGKYEALTTVVLLPVVLWLCRLLEENDKVLVLTQRI